MRALLRSMMQSRPDARASDREFWPFDQPGRASEHARTAAPFTGATAHCVSNMSVERSVSRGEARAGAEVSLKKPSGERERENGALARASLSLLAPFSARRHSARSARSAQVTTGTRQRTQAEPGPVYSTARIGRVAVKRLAPDRQSPTSSPLATLLSLCVWSGARVSRRCSTPRAAREGGRERGRRISVLASSRLPSRG